MTFLNITFNYMEITMNLLTSKKLLTVIISSALLSACGGSSSGSDEKSIIETPPVAKFNVVNLDATDGSQAGHLDLVSSSKVTDDTWQIAYQKYFGFKLNGGASATGNVSGCVAHEYTDLFDADGNPVVDKFKALTGATTLTDFNKVDATACMNFVFDALQTTIVTEDWLDADYSLGIPTYSAKANNGWIVRSADGESYSRVKVTSVDVAFGETTTRKVTLSSELWNGSVFEPSIDSPVLDFSSERVFWDLETNTLVTDSDEWDLSLMVKGQNYPLQVNGGASASVGSPGMGGAGVVMGTGGIDGVTDPTSTAQVYKFFADSASGVLSAPGNYGPLQYAVDGGHAMWPTFTTYLIKDESATDMRLFKVQIMSNYGEIGELPSANLVFRYQEIIE
jgi:hypothetical protein